MKKPKYFFDKDPWMLAEDIPNIDFFFCSIWLPCFVNRLKNSCGRNYKKVLAVFDPKFYIHFYFGEKDSLNLELHLVNKIKKNPAFGRAINKNIVTWSDQLRFFATKINTSNLKKLKNQQLVQLLRKQDQVHTDLYEWGWLSNATDMFHGSFTGLLNAYLANQLGKFPQKQSASEIFNVLTSPRKKSVAAIQDEELLRIAAKAKNPKNKKKVQELLNRHYEKYFYLKYLWIGTAGVYSRYYFVHQLAKMQRDTISPREKIRQASLALQQANREKKKIYANLKIDQKHQQLFEVYSDFMLTKIYRRYAQIYWAYHMKKLLREVGTRLHLDLNEVRHMTSNELIVGLQGGGVNVGEIRKRLKFFWYYGELGSAIISTDKSHSILKQIGTETHGDVNELVGQIACLGKVTGRVRIINNAKDMAKMSAGDILVSIATNPDLVPAMKKAGAIVTEQGGVTSHAAIVSRELNIPCVIGTKIATKVLKDGDMVEVDATMGIIRKI